MAISKIAVALLLLAGCSIDASLLPAPVAPIAYARAIPYNVLPYANSVNIFTKTLYPHYAAVTTPFVKAFAPAPAPVAFASPVAPALPPVFAPAPAFAPAAAWAPAPVPVPAFAHAPVPAPVPAFAAAPALAPFPVARVNSFLPAPFAAAPVPAAYRPAGVVAPALAPAPVYPEFARSIHGIAPAVAPGLPAPFFRK